GRVTRVAAAEGFSLAVTSAGQLYSSAVGRPAFGCGEAEEANPPTLVKLPRARGRVTQLATGGNLATLVGGRFSLALTSTGQLYAWGNNFWGQLGTQANSGTEEPNPTPTLVTLPGQD